MPSPRMSTVVLLFPVAHVADVEVCFAFGVEDGDDDGVIGIDEGDGNVCCIICACCLCFASVEDILFRHASDVHDFFATELFEEEGLDASAFDVGDMCHDASPVS